MQKKLFFLIISFLLVLSCSPKVKLTDETIEKYLKAYKGMKAVSPELAKNISTNKVNIAQGMEGFNKIESVIKNAGFTNYAEFVKVNAAIAWSFSKVQGEKFMSETNKNVNSGLATIDKQLNSPNVPEAVKKQLRIQREQLVKDYSKNKPWADLVISGVSKLTDKESLEVIKRHSKELERAFQGR